MIALAWVPPVALASYVGGRALGHWLSYRNNLTPTVKESS